jgi:RIO-like serine/threonine protein kinase
MNYQTQLETILEELLNQFEDDPEIGWIHYDVNDFPVHVNDELGELLDRANDLIYGQKDDDGLLGGEGYPTEEEG